MTALSPKNGPASPLAEHGPSLSARAFIAGIWTVGVRLLSRGVDFIALLVLARFLGPADFGLVAMAMTVVFIVEAILDLPLSAALIRVPEITDRMYDTAFTLSLLRSILLAAIMIGLSWPLSVLYGDARLVPLICALSIAPALRGMINPRMILFEKALDFRRNGILELCGKITAAVAAIVIAVTTGSYWAMAAGTILSPTVMMVISYFMAPAVPRLTLADWPVLSNMIGWNFVSQIVSAINWQVDRIMLPRYIDVAAFGHFATANDVASLPHQAIVAPTTTPLLSALVDAHARGNLVGAYLKASAGIVTIMAPVLCFLAMMNGPVIQILLGSKWEDAGPIMGGIALVGLIVLPTTPMPALAMALDRTRSIAFRTLIEFLVRVPLTAAGIIAFGVMGAIAAKAGASIAALFVALIAVRSLAGISIRQQLAVNLRPVLALLPASLLLHEANTFLAFEDYLYLDVIVTGMAFVAVYTAGLFSAWLASGRPPGLESHALDVLAARVRRFR